MCKIMVLKGVQESVLALEFMKAVAPNMSVFNTDGIGYSAINSKNELFSEKWHNNLQFLDTEKSIDVETFKALEPYKAKLPYLKVNYQSYGNVTRDDIRTVTMHTRYATCGKDFENTHPFIVNDTSLIHNGVINNANVLKLNQISTCDSENALQLYLNHNLALSQSPDSIQSMIDKLKGYWAFAFLAKGSDGIYNLDIVREGASLYWADLPELGADCTVFATTSEIIEAGVTALGLNKPEIFFLPAGNYTRYNAITGEYVFDAMLSESVLNKTPVYNYNSSSTYRGSDAYSKYWEEFYDNDTTPVVTDNGKQEGFRNKVDKISTTSDDFTIDGFYETDTVLIDRLYGYDSLMGTNYGNNFEDIPPKIQDFIERKEEEDYLIFDDILVIIDSYFMSDSVNAIYAAYKKLKRA